MRPSGTQAVQVPVYVLDLTTFTPDAVATFSIADVCPAGVVPAWQKRFEVLRAQVRAVLQRYDTLVKMAQKDNGPGLPKDVDAIVQRSLTESVTGVVSGEMSLKRQSVAFDLKRVGRVRHPRAGGMLRDYAYYKARDAFDHDLTRSWTDRCLPDAGRGGPGPKKC
jgi:hypothetical protein